MTTCKLCGLTRELCRSHIVPEFLYSDLYNNKNEMMAISGRGNLGWKPIQSGIWEKLLCGSCEQLLNNRYEMPFLSSWIQNNPLPNPFGLDSVVPVTVDYVPFKLFHLSVLFRAGVSSRPEFNEVNLGVHEDRLRKLLLNCDPGDEWQYPIFGAAVVHHRTNEIVKIVSRAERIRFGGRPCYAFIYGGAKWWIGVAADRIPALDEIALRSTGHMNFHAIPWNELHIMQQASRGLRSPNRSGM